ncbi:MAG TPA: antitoxin Xre/MbcA/ParS toxin-binding domain-containing protein [Terriglobales bacterium]|nr:antitoxin Xre/MbcA/ParS toxin-binding domain-containing protein [Terriglobales bacterium]
MAQSDKIASGHLPGKTLGLHAHSSGELIRQVGHGFSFASMQALESRSGISLSEIASLIGLPPRTFARRKASGRLSSDESEKLLRLSTVFEHAVELFEGDRAGALRWLTTPKKALDNETPLTYSRTEVGAREVENLIGRLEHGVFA